MKVLQVLLHHIDDERLTLVAKVITLAMDEQDIRCVSSSGVGLGLGTEYPLGIGRNRLKISRVPGIVKK